MRDLIFYLAYLPVWLVVCVVQIILICIQTVVCLLSRAVTTMVGYLQDSNVRYGVWLREILWILRNVKKS